MPAPYWMTAHHFGPIVWWKAVVIVLGVIAIVWSMWRAYKDAPEEDEPLWRKHHGLPKDCDPAEYGEDGRP